MDVCLCIYKNKYVIHFCINYVLVECTFIKQKPLVKNLLSGICAKSPYLDRLSPRVIFYENNAYSSLYKWD